MTLKSTICQIWSHHRRKVIKVLTWRTIEGWQITDPLKEQNFSPGWRENWTKKKSVKTTKCLLAATASHKCGRDVAVQDMSLVTCHLLLLLLLVMAASGGDPEGWLHHEPAAACILGPDDGRKWKRGSLWSRCLAANNWGTHLHRKDWLAREDNWQTNECLCLHSVYLHWIRTMKV